MLNTDSSHSVSAITSNNFMKNALRERLKTNLLYKLPSCRFSEESKEEEDISNINIDVDSNSDNSDETDMNSTVPLEERRLRNRLAARKCREKRKQRITSLEKVCMELEKRMDNLKKEIHGLDNQKQSLTRLLNNHHCVRTMKHLA